MTVETLSRLYGGSDEQGVFLSYQGPMWQGLLEDLNELVKKKAGEQVNPGLIGRYLTLFVELVQNIVRYSSSKIPVSGGALLSQGVLVVGTQNGRNYILSGNTVDPSRKEALLESLNELTRCDQEALSTLFRQQLRSSLQDKSSGAAGLGLIDIFRKADRVDYRFIEREGEDDFFAMRVELLEGAL